MVRYAGNNKTHYVSAEEEAVLRRAQSIFHKQGYEVELHEKGQHRSAPKKRKQRSSGGGFAPMFPRINF